MKTYTPVQAQQSGYILILSAMFLFILAAGSIQFFNRATESTVISGALRDSTQSLLLAESAMDYMRGQFTNGRINTDATTRIAACADANGNTFDDCESYNILVNKGTPNADLFSYMYYVTNGSGIDSTTPTLLQKVADGEAFNSAVGALDNQWISTATTRTRISNLFGNTFAPRLYTLNANGRLISSAAASWSAETNAAKAAVWIEVTENAGDSDVIDLFVQSAAQVGKSKSYVQRYVGSFGSGQILGEISTIAESSNIDRSTP